MIKTAFTFKFQYDWHQYFEGSLYILHFYFCSEQFTTNSNKNINVHYTAFSLKKYLDNDQPQN